MCNAGKGTIERIRFALTHGGPLSADELATKTAKPKGTIHPALNVMRQTGQVKRYAQIMSGRPGRPRVVYQVTNGNQAS